MTPQYHDNDFSFYLPVYLENTWYFAGFLGFASDFAPVPRPALGLRETRELPEWSTKHLWFPWKFPETKSAGDPLLSFLVSGKQLQAKARQDRGRGGDKTRTRSAIRSYVSR